MSNGRCELNWRSSETPRELHTLLKHLGEEYPVYAGSDRGIRVEFIKSTTAGVSKAVSEEKRAVITYDRPHHAARALGAVMAGTDSDEKAAFKTLGIMLDCSRNAVMKVDYFKRWLRRLALLGYNMAMLYTEDTYQLPSEPCFGYLRGPYTMEEIKELDDYAAGLGIEIIACIQTLGHLEQILQWSPFGKVKDTTSVLLVDEPETYALIDKMVSFWSEALRSRRIHIGMDETHDLGRGRFMDLFGYERGFDIFNRHLSKVNEICAKYGYEHPMIWSDMYFRMSNPNGDYYDRESAVPDDIKERIPRNVELVYWDYYHKEEDFYCEWIKRHRELGFNPLMGSGVWTWGRLWYDHRRTVETVNPCISACRKSKVDELFFTMWGDDGSYCEFDSAFAGLTYCAELSFNHTADEKSMADRFEAVCGADYQASLLAGEIEDYSVKSANGNVLLSPAALWDDPLYAIVERSFGSDASAVMTQIRANWSSLKANLEKLTDNGRGNIEHAVIVLDTLIGKIDYRQQLLAAYGERDDEALNRVAEELTPRIIEKMEILHYSLRQQWMRRNKPLGFEVLQARLDALIGRYQEIAVRIKELLDGEIEQIDELEVAWDSQGYNYTHCYNRIAMPPFSRF